MTAKSLKAKTARKAAKPTKRKRAAIACPVEKLGRENERLNTERRIIEGLAEKMTAQEKEDATRLILLIEDKMRSNRHAATYLQPRSGLGAVFLLLSAYADLKNMTHERDGEGRTESFRRAERALYGLKDWFFNIYEVSPGLVAGGFYMPWHHNPHPHLRKIMTNRNRGTA